MPKLKYRFLSLLVLLSICVALIPVQVRAADYIAANHTKSNGCPYYIMVNRSCNTVTVYTLDDNGYYTVPYKAMVCSTGRSGHRTPTGTFSITSVKKRWCLMVDGSYGQYSSQFSGNYLFHSVCYYSNNVSRLMTYEYNALGDYASLGCVRLQVIDAKWIYDNCCSGTKVTIYDGTDPGPLGKPEKAVSYISEEDDCGWEPTDPAPGNPWNNKLTVTAAASDACSGTGTVTGGGSYRSGETATLTASPADDCEFIGWYDAGGKCVSTNREYSFTVSADYAVEARFEKRTYTLSVVSSHAGAVSGGGQYYAGMQATLTARNVDGRGFAGWYDAEGTLLSTASSYRVNTFSWNSRYYAMFDGDLAADIAEDEWYYTYVSKAYNSGILKGVSAVSFEPDGLLTRAMAITIIARLEGADSAASAKATAFKDVEAGSWYSAAVAWGTENGIVNGTSATTFEPDAYITREDFMTMLLRYVCSYRRYSVALAQMTFSDSASVSDYAKDALARAVTLGLLKGYEDNTIRPQETMTRAECAAFVMRLQSFLNKE